MEEKNKKIATHGTFINQKESDYSLIKEKLKKLVQQKLKKEKTEILQEIENVLSQDKISDIINPESAGFSISPQEWHWLDRHNQSKWLEYMVYRYKFKVYPSQRKLLDFPIYLLIEPTPVCNLRCVMCFQVDDIFKTKEYIGMMPWDLFKNIVDQAKDKGTQAVTLASRGEPLLHKDFGKMLHYLNQSGILDIKINTNATIMNEKHIHDILSAQVSEVVFSVDAATKKTYEAIRRGGKFKQVVKNIKKFHQIREKKYSSSPTITRISGVRIREDQDIQQMSGFWSEIVDEVAIKKAIPRWDTYNNPILNLEKPCTPLWRQMYVWFDGTVNPCDFDYRSYLALGNAYKNSLEEIWQGEKFSQLRQEHLKGKRTQNPCDKCPLG